MNNIKEYEKFLDKNSPWNKIEISLEEEIQNAIVESYLLIEESSNEDFDVLYNKLEHIRINHNLSNEDFDLFVEHEIEALNEILGVIARAGLVGARLGGARLISKAGKLVPKVKDLVTKGGEKFKSFIDKIRTKPPESSVVKTPKKPEAPKAPKKPEAPKAPKKPEAPQAPKRFGMLKKAATISGIGASIYGGKTAYDQFKSSAAGRDVGSAKPSTSDIDSTEPSTKSDEYKVSKTPVKSMPTKDLESELKDLNVKRAKLAKLGVGVGDPTKSYKEWKASSGRQAPDDEFEKEAERKTMEFKVNRDRELTTKLKDILNKNK